METARRETTASSRSVVHPSIYLVRHAHAGVRGAWSGDDDLRPLSPFGWQQAWHLADRLRRRRITGLLSSPSTRCRQTLEPLAKACGLPITFVGELGDGVPVDRVLPVLEAAASGPTVVCTHGTVIEESLASLLAAGMRPRPDAPILSEKGSIWILGRDGGAFVEGRYLGPVPSTVHDLPAGRR